MQNEFPVVPIEYVEDTGDARSRSIDFVALLTGVLRRWKLITAITLSLFITTYGVLKLKPLLYKSTAEILVFDPQRQIDSAIQKPISPFVDALNNDAMNTEIEVIKSKSIALRVARQLGLDTDPEFQPHDGLAKRYFQLHDLLAQLAERLPYLGRANSNSNNSAQTNDGSEEDKDGKLDRAADTLLSKLEVAQISYIITVSVTSLNPIKAQRITAAVADDYLVSQREARQEALERVATWLKGRIEDLQSRVSETAFSIEKLKAESGIHDTEYGFIRQQQINGLTQQITAARSEVDEKRARLDQARHLSDIHDDMHGLTSTPDDIQSIPELVSSQALLQLRQKQVDLTWRAANLQNKLGGGHAEVIALRAELAGINKQINAEIEHVLGNIRNSYDIAVRREQGLQADLQRLTAGNASEAAEKLGELQHLADADRNLYQSYLSQYNDISERRTLQDASARIISPASVPRWPTSSRTKLYMIGGVLSLGGGFLIAFLIEYFRPGVKTSTEVEQSFGRPVLGIIPLMQYPKSGGTSVNRLLRRMVDEPISHFSDAVHAVRISLELSTADLKVILITSALPGEGKSTAAMLLAASSASSGKRTVLLDCDLRQQTASKAFENDRQPGLSELLRDRATLSDVTIRDSTTKTYVIPAGSMVPNAADLLMSRRMRDLIAELRGEFECIVMDAPPLLPVIDALPLATVADKVLVVVEWGHTPRPVISEAFKVLRPEAHRIAGIVLNKVDLNQLQGYGRRGYPYTGPLAST